MATTITASPFDESKLPFSTKNKSWIEVKENCEYYGLVRMYVAKNATINAPHQSFRASKGKLITDMTKDFGVCTGESKGANYPHETRVVPCVSMNLSIGVGLHTFTHKEETLHALLQLIGDPVGSNCGVDRYETMVLFCDGPVDTLTTFLGEIIAESEKEEAGSFKVYKWHPQYNYWQQKARVKARSLDSVILPEKVTSELLEDIERFLSKDAEDFYLKHGIPYRRSYLFYGVPGTGKTSLIQALAGRLGRSISYMQPTHPKLTDDSLQDAMERLPKNTIVVFEDIDSLFSKDRSSKTVQSNLTFSGLLNALDGVGSSNGQLCILTTNLREQLDPALIRSGRVDMHVPFSYATDKQMQKMWMSYYPESSETEAHAFSDGVLQRAQEMKQQIPAAELQGFFIANRMKSSTEALENLNLITEEINRRVKAEASKKLALEKKMVASIVEAACKCTLNGNTLAQTGAQATDFTKENLEALRKVIEQSKPTTLPELEELIRVQMQRQKDEKVNEGGKVVLTTDNKKKKNKKNNLYPNAIAIGTIGIGIGLMLGKLRKLYRHHRI